jgi:tetratricopeptide (TPR) repeat protein
MAKRLATLTKRANDTGIPSDFAPLRPHAEHLSALAESADPQNSATLWNNLGAHLNALADHAAAKAAYERALRIDEAVFGPDHPEVATDVNNLAFLYKEMGDKLTARQLWERALAILEKFLPPGHPYIGIVKRALADLDEEGS